MNVVLKSVLASLETISAEGFKVIPQVVQIVSDLIHKLRWFIVGIVILVVVKGMIPWIVGLWVGKSLFSLLFLFLR